MRTALYRASLLPLLSLAVVGVLALNCSSKSKDNSRTSGPAFEQVTETSLAPVEPKSPAEADSLKAADALAATMAITPASTVSEGTMKLRKDRLFNREFLYGFDLQYSSSSDPNYSLIPQAQAIGHIPAFFRAISGQLQLLQDQTRLFESNINHPEKLIAEWEVLTEDADTITVRYQSSGLLINEVFNGKGSPAPDKTWIRSLKFVEQGEYILQESAILLRDGAVQTYFESIFPRANLVPAGYEAFDTDPSINPIADRYRFLSNEKVFVDRTDGGETTRSETAFASRYNIANGATIDWYVTANVPERFMPVMKSGTEGWNRYYRTQVGRDVVRFMGRLPADISIGDPRYNVINWDSVAQAGAAYESQAADPMTGIQSHSLVYMPFAWYNIGVELWARRVDTNMPTADQLRALVSAKSPEVLSSSRRNPVACVLSAEDMATPVAEILEAINANRTDSSSLPNTDDFGQRLMIAVLFHEVGHALGLHHNFKGSLAFDGTRPVGPTNVSTTSIMDYNYYQLEQDLFTQIGGTDGPILEYDRQIISQLYNKGADVTATDAVLAACNDDEADNTTGGLDPLCVRYDSENDPILGVQHSLNNFVSATGAAGTEAQTLAEVLTELKNSVALRFSDGTRSPDQAALQADAKKLGGQIGELANYFISGGAQSVRVNLRNNSKALRVWAPGAPVDELSFRQRYTEAFKTAVALRQLPAAPAASLADLQAAVVATVAANALAGATEAERLAAGQKAGDALASAANLKIQKSLVRMRSAIYGEIGFNVESSFAILLGDAATLSHFEALAAETLALGTLIGLDAPAGKVGDSAAERATAVAQLATFKGIHPAVEQTISQLQAFVIRGDNEGNQAMRDEARVLLGKLRY